MANQWIQFLGGCLNLTRLPRTYYFSGGYIKFYMEGKMPRYAIYQQLLEEPTPILQAVGAYTEQDLAELAKPYVLEPQYKRILKQ